MIILHDYWRSSSAYRVRIALNLLGLPYESRPVDLLAGEQTGAENLARNPQGLVPTLEIDGLRLTQSLAILEYLDETRAAGFLPPDPVGRARVRALALAVAAEIQPVCNLRVARHAVSESQGGITQEGWMRHFIALGLQGLEGMLDDAPGPYCHGDRVTLPDLCLVPQAYNARRWGVDLGPFPRIAAIVAALEALPAVQAAHPDRVAPAVPPWQGRGPHGRVGHPNPIRGSKDSDGGMSKDFDLEAFLPYLLNQAAEAASQGFAQVYRTRYAMTRTQWRVLANLGKFGAMTARDICRISHLEKTKVSRAVAALEERGWLTRETSPEDRRAEILRLTPDGHGIYGQLGTLAVDHDRHLRETLGAERARAFAEILRELAALGASRGEEDDLA